MDFYIHQFTGIDEANFLIDVYMTLNLHWNDPWLKMNNKNTTIENLSRNQTTRGINWEAPITNGEGGGGSNWIALDDKFKKILWIPDIHVYSMRSVETISLFKPFGGENIS